MCYSASEPPKPTVGIVFFVFFSFFFSFQYFILSVRLESMTTVFQTSQTELIAGIKPSANVEEGSVRVASHPSVLY